VERCASSKVGPHQQRSESIVPTYYFDIAQGDRVEEDHKGKHAESIDEARDIAAKSILDLLHAEGKAITGAVIEIRDSSRDLVASVPVDLGARLEVAKESGARHA
jgi:uncharacterized protein DUF6894